MEKIEVKELLFLLDLVERIAEYYEGEGLVAVGMLGLKEGIRNYFKNERYKDDMKLGTYVSWWIKTAIEKSLEKQAKEDNPDSTP